MASKQIDIAVFCEYSGTDFLSLGSAGFIQYDGLGGCDKVTLIAKNNCSVKIQREQHRYTLYSISSHGELFIIAAVHLQDRFHTDTETRIDSIGDLVRDIIELEHDLDCSNTIVLGDMNANPFDPEMIQKNAFNAVLYKQLILDEEYVSVNEKTHRRFYNPMLVSISEATKNYGSYYHSNGMNTTYWHCLDQVIVRRPLANRIRGITYCKTAGEISLSAFVGPNKRISDHYPLVFCISEEELHA